jgi:hypothetical protein
MTLAAAAIDDNTVGVIAIISVFGVFPFAIAYARLIWKRASDPRPRSATVDADTQQRLLHIQQSIDSIAIEVERLSEGQRFVTKVLAQRDADLAGGSDAKRLERS